MRRDSAYSWVIAVSCSFIVFCTLGMFRTSGVFFLELPAVFNVTREAAVWPIGIAGFLLSLCASLPGFLITFFSLRQILLVGITLVSSGLGLCYFATSTGWFTLFYGAIFAIGCGLCIPSCSIMTNSHFVKYRGIANSILMSGDSLALFLMAPLTSYLLKEYDFRGACLIIGGIFGNLFVLLMIIRPFQGTIVKPQPTDQKLEGKPNNEAKSTLLEHSKATQNSSLKSKLKITLRNYWVVLKDPMYQICTTTQAFYSVIVVLYCIIIADYGIDCGMEKSEAILLITVTGASELAGRACVGYIIDKNILKPKFVSSSSQIIVSMILITQTLVGNTSIVHFILSLFFGLLSGCVYGLGNVIYVQYLGVEQLGIALSLKSFLIAILAFLRPILIAVCREHYGSYVYLFYILAALALSFGLSWCFEPIIMSQRTQTNNIFANGQRSEAQV